MTTLNDEILRATGGPTVNDGLSTWFGRTSSETLQDAEFRWLGIQGATSDTIADRWMEFLGPGQLNDLKFVYWSAQP